MTENLCAPDFSDQVVVLKDAAMRFEFRACLERENEMFMSQANKLGKVTVLCNGGWRVSWHAVILP